MITQEEVYKIGVIGRPHALGGELSLHFTDDVFDRVDAQYLILEVDGLLVPFFMETYRFKTDSTALVKFCDVDTVEQARQLTDCPVFFPRALRDEDDDSISLAELVGFSVFKEGTTTLIGTVTAVDDSTINTLLEVQCAEGGTVLIPFSDELATEVDIAQHRITLIIPKGLLEMF